MRKFIVTGMCAWVGRDRKDEYVHGQGAFQCTFFAAHHDEGFIREGAEMAVQWANDRKITGEPEGCVNVAITSFMIWQITPAAN